MVKNKRRLRNYSNILERRFKPNVASSPSASRKKSKPQHPRQASQRPVPPFNPCKDRILLIGEGNLSFAISLLKHHKCRNVTATTYDTEKESLIKYGEGVQTNISYIRCLLGLEKKPDDTLQSNEDLETKTENDAREDEGGEDKESNCDWEEDDGTESQNSSIKKEVKLLFGVDARKLTKTKQLKNKQFDVIIFNFPHVGGITKDQDRQARANQELLLSFFQSSEALLSPSGSIVLTLFTGKPYDLWDVKFLAKSCNLRVRKSFKFDKDMYPGYEHARTIGVIHRKGEDGKGGWKGEERDARCFIFEKNDINVAENGKNISGKKRKREVEESSSSDDEN